MSPSNAPLKTEELMYLNCFAKAHKDGEFTISCESVQEARRYKMALNRAKKKLTERRDLQAEHPQYLSACLDTSVALKANPDRLVLYRTDSSEFNRKLMMQLGMLPEDNMLAEDAAIKKSMERMKEMLGEGIPPEQEVDTANPYASVLNDSVPTGQPKLSMKELMRQTLEREKRAQEAEADTGKQEVKK